MRFFVVRKGDIVGIYKDLSDCQAQVGSSVYDPPVSVYKGYLLPKETDEYLSSVALKKPLYSFRASDLKEDMFGSSLTPCLVFFTEPTSCKGKEEDTSEMKPKDKIKENSTEPSSCNGKVSEETEDTSKMNSKDRINDNNKQETKKDLSSLLKYSVSQPLLTSMPVEPLELSAAGTSKITCFIEFDGASKGNPGLAGAAAVLKAEDGSLICKVRQGLGIATCNVAEYHALILGLKYAIEKGYKKIRVKGDSMLVCMQIRGRWKVKNEVLLELHKEAKQLISNKCVSFQISHVLRNLNSDADEQANLAACLAEGEIEVA